MTTKVWFDMKIIFFRTTGISRKRLYVLTYDSHSLMRALVCSSFSMNILNESNIFEPTQKEGGLSLKDQFPARFQIGYIYNAYAIS